MQAAVRMSFSHCSLHFVTVHYGVLCPSPGPPLINVIMLSLGTALSSYLNTICYSILTPEITMIYDVFILMNPTFS